MNTLTLLEEALGASESSNEFYVEDTGWVTVELRGTIDGNTLTAKISESSGSGFTDFYGDGALITLTEAEVYKIWMPGGRYIRFDSDGTGTPDIDIFIHGAVRLV